MGRALDAVRRANRTKRPEESVTLRVTVLATVLLAVAMAWFSGAANSLPSMLALLALPVGAWVSHQRRADDNVWLKVGLALGAVLLLWQFFGSLGTAATIDDTRAPLATLFLGVQVLHGFDLPQRRDLGFTLVSSLAIVALAGTASNANVFGLLMVVYAVVAAAALAAMQRSAAREEADELLSDGCEELEVAEPSPVQGRPSPHARDGGLGRSAVSAARSTLPVLGPVLLIGALVFLLLPRSESNALRNLPFRGLPGLSIGSGLVTNPGLDDGGSNVRSADDPPPDFNPAAYFGFAEYVDLRTVGELSAEPVMRVRSNRPRLWRGMVFDTYTGVGWTRSTDPDEAVEERGLPVRLSDLDGVQATRTDTVTQTFELLADTPNLVFAAAEPEAVFLAGRTVRRYPDGTIVTPQLMEAETIYSVISEIVVTEPDLLRRRLGPVPDAIRTTYIQLPDDISQRVRDLAAEITADAPTPYGKAEAVEAWLGANTAYTLQTTPPPGSDPVDHFLFESREGWCEPIASAMVVMLRTQGVPARFVTGFQPGDRNPLTSVWDVRMDQAHAWVEVWIPDEGWVAFDPTGAVPYALGDSRVSNIPLIELGQWAADAAAELVPEGVKEQVRAIGTRVRAEPLLAIVPAAVLALAAFGTLRWRRARRRLRDEARLSPFERAERLLALRGVERSATDTPREFVAYAHRVRPDLPRDALGQLLFDEERRRYAPPELHGDDQAAEAALEALRMHLTEHPTGYPVVLTARG